MIYKTFYSLSSSFSFYISKTFFSNLFCSSFNSSIIRLWSLIYDSKLLTYIFKSSTSFLVYLLIMIYHFFKNGSLFVYNSLWYGFLLHNPFWLILFNFQLFLCNLQLLIKILNFSQMIFFSILKKILLFFQ